MNPIIKWPGGKSREIKNIQHLIPPFNRYIEPFFGGGALFFNLEPEHAEINDISQNLIEFYTQIQIQDNRLHNLLICYSNSFNNLILQFRNRDEELTDLFYDYQQNGIDITKYFADMVNEMYGDNIDEFNEQIILNLDEFKSSLVRYATDKFCRTVTNHNKKPFSNKDLIENLVTGFASGYYMYFRKVFNDINLNRIDAPSLQYRIANFYFVREYCYGSMFRYNRNGEFNIPYGGMSYNKKNMTTKIDKMFNENIQTLFHNTNIHNQDFEDFLNNIHPHEGDFIFLDPPYDTDFSDYEGRDFTLQDQERLANALINTEANFILVIKNTDFIRGLYEGHFNIISFDKQYTYNVRSRNNRDVEHLIITNLPV